MDIRMPDIDGYQATQIIRKLERDSSRKIRILYPQSLLL
ncbi:MAG: hypothetical protein HC903_13445 [Methylacidiphilales bacterium]|nr:hypothetical protein [Candidatus Methylacidiphilales bacterium]